MSFEPLPIGTHVVIVCPVHRMDGCPGVVEYYSPGWGTYGVRFGEFGTFGFRPSEVRTTDS